MLHRLQQHLLLLLLLLPFFASNALVLFLIGCFFSLVRGLSGFVVNEEADNYLLKGRICHMEGYHCRGESWPFCERGAYLEAPFWATYAHLLWQLTFGVDMPGLSEPNLVNTTCVSCQPPSPRAPRRCTAARVPSLSRRLYWPAENSPTLPSRRTSHAEKVQVQIRAVC